MDLSHGGVRGFVDDLMYIYINTPNVGLMIAVPDREGEQGRFGGSTEGARGSIQP